MPSERGAVQENITPWPKKPMLGNNHWQYRGKRIYIHVAEFVAWCYDEEKAKGVLDKRRGIFLYGGIPGERC